MKTLSTHAIRDNLVRLWISYTEPRSYDAFKTCVAISEKHPDSLGTEFNCQRQIHSSCHIFFLRFGFVQIIFNLF